MNPAKASLSEKFELIHEPWRPKIVAQLNGQELKLVKFLGEFPWHSHENEDELFLVWRGQMTIEFRQGRVVLNTGELCVVPRGVEHRTVAEPRRRSSFSNPLKRETRATSWTKSSQHRMGW